MNKISFQSINVLDIDYEDYAAQVSDINDFVASNRIIEKELFVIVNAQDARCNLSTDFDKLCQRVSKLIDNQIAIDIKIRVTNTNPISCVKISKIFSSCFENEKFLGQYNQPKCNSQLCVPLIKPNIFLEQITDFWGNTDILMVVTNVNYV